MVLNQAMSCFLCAGRGRVEQWLGLKWEIWIFKILLSVNPTMALSFKLKDREKWLNFWTS